MVGSMWSVRMRRDKTAKSTHGLRGGDVFVEESEV